MNEGNRQPRRTLGLCPRCGMDSGERMILDSVPELYVVVCRTCGCRTRLYQTKGAETRAWNRGDIYREQNSRRNGYADHSDAEKRGVL